MPFILGNDFADQYSISTIRNQGNTHLEFGSTGRTIPVENSTISSFLNDQGETFKVSISKSIHSSRMKQKAHQKSKKARRKWKVTLQNPYIHASQSLIIPPETVKLVPVYFNSPSNSDCVFMEKLFFNGRSMEDVYAAPDSLIPREKPQVHITNFTKYPIAIHQGQVIGTKHNPKTWLTQQDQCSPKELSTCRGTSGRRTQESWDTTRVNQVRRIARCCSYFSRLNQITKRKAYKTSSTATRGFWVGWKAGKLQRRAGN